MVCSTTLGERPFFALPADCALVNQPDMCPFARFPFRPGDGLHWIEGPSWNANTSISREVRRDKQFPARELRRNRTLPETRAQSVVAALTGKGIDVSRLSAAGFGQDKPIADNATEEGKAKNRRVELVKRRG